VACASKPRFLLIDTLLLLGAEGNNWYGATDRLFALDSGRQRIFAGEGANISFHDGVFVDDTQTTALIDSWHGTGFGEPGILALNPANGLLYYNAGRLTVFDPTKPLGAPRFFEAGPNDSGQGVTLDGNSNAVSGVMNLPGRHFGGSVVVDPARERLFVAPGWFGVLLNDGTEDINLDSEILVISE
jgi:hypothetical protein